MRGVVAQINISAGGVPKLPISAASVHSLGIAGDDHAHMKYHGGPSKALLLLAAEVVDQLSSEGWPLFYGALGENLTTRGIDHSLWRPGQQFRAGAVILQLTTPRQPCATLSCYGAGIQQRIFDTHIKNLDSTSPRWGMSGFYASILEPGTIRSLDIIELIDPS
jgi:MOSC domain-containing protein YiiM